MAHVATFQEALEIVESLPEGQQDDLVDVLRRRRSEARRGALAKRAEEALAELERGEVRRGSVADLMREVDG